MVGIVVVSHSRLLAEGVAQLANQMTQGKTALAIAGGVDDPENPIGTDAIAVMEAISTVDDPGGVLVLMDLGSALLSTEMALELLDPEIGDRVALCSAPVVEGTMAAAVAAAAGLSLEAVKAEAMDALAGKQSHLGDVPAAAAGASAPAADMRGALSTDWVVANPHGLHARPAAAVVTALAPFTATLELAKGDVRANAKSLNSIAKLGVKCGDHIELLAQGVDAAEAIAAFRSLAAENFGESIDAIGSESEAAADEPETILAESTPGAIRGIAVSAGIAMGPAVHFTVAMPAVPERPYSDAAQELERIQRAVAQCKAVLEQQAGGAAGKVDKSHAEIFQAHALMLSDPELLAEVKARIDSGLIAEQAWLECGTELADSYRHADSTYMRERETDAWDITRQVMVALCGCEGTTLQLDKPAVVLAEDLTPSDTMKLDPQKVLAICLSQGGKTSHSAILARAMGIPAIVKASGCLELVEPGQQVTVDGFSGLLWLEPDEQTQATLAERQQAWLEEQTQQRAAAHEPAVTLDGQHFQVMANIGGLNDVAKALESGAEGVGLLRTEFLFQASDTLPSEEEQYRVYHDIAAALGDCPLTIRSLDVGGDKPLASYPMAEEENPFLGLRGVRLCLADPSLLKTQLRAVLRAAAERGNIQLMIPMIAQVSELQAVKALLAECRAELGLTEQDAPMPVGIMIEVPAAVLDAQALAQEADFFSIGTNDLTQYVMAADRGNGSVASLVDYRQPAVLRAIEMTCEAARQAGIPVGMCGEMAGDTAMTERLIAMGVTKLSASASLIPAVKSQIRELDTGTFSQP